MCEKISDMIKGYATAPEMKLRLIPMFQHMHHDARTAQIVRQTCIEMLPGKLDLWYDFLAGSASPSFQHVAKTLKMAEVY